MKYPLMKNNILKSDINFLFEFKFKQKINFNKFKAGNEV